MILPIYAYGQPVLRKKASDITMDYEGLESLIGDMYETMYKAKGVGLAAPQIGRDIRVFVVDTVQLNKKDSKLLVSSKSLSMRRSSEKSDFPGLEKKVASPKPNILGEIERNPFFLLPILDEKGKDPPETFEGFMAPLPHIGLDSFRGVSLFFDKKGPPRKKGVSPPKSEKNPKRGPLNSPPP